MTHHPAPRPCTASDQAIGGGCYNCGAGFPDRLTTPTFQFVRLHIPTGQRIDGTMNGSEEQPLTERDALRLINKWNSQQPGLWQYWLP